MMWCIAFSFDIYSCQHIPSNCSFIAGGRYSKFPFCPHIPRTSLIELSPRCSTSWPVPAFHSEFRLCMATPLGFWGTNSNWALLRDLFFCRIEVLLAPEYHNQLESTFLRSICKLYKASPISFKVLNIRVSFVSPFLRMVAISGN